MAAKEGDVVNPLAGNVLVDMIVSFTFNNAMHGISRDGKVWKMDRNRINWIDTGMQLT